MSRNLSRTLFYEFYKSDPNFIYESVEEYRNYKLDPNFTDKTLEEYRRTKAKELKKENAIIQEPHEEVIKLEQSISDCTKDDIAIKDLCEESAKEIINEAEKKIEENVIHEIEKAISELEIESLEKEKFEKSLEPFWDCEGASALADSETLSTCSNSDCESIFNSEVTRIFTTKSELNSNRKPNSKGRKSKFRIPKSRSIANFKHVKPRYMDVFKKN